MRGLLLSPEQVFKLHCEELKSNTLNTLRADVCKVLKLLHLTNSWLILHTCTVYTLHSWELWITLSLTILITVTSCPYCGVCDLVPRTDQRPGIPGREIRNFGPSSEISSEDSGSERRGGENTRVSPVTVRSGGGDISKCYVNTQTNLASSIHIYVAQHDIFSSAIQR